MTDPLRLAAGLGFIFDMDGVLIESTKLHTEVWERYLKRQGISNPDVMSRMLGKRNDEIVVALFG